MAKNVGKLDRVARFFFGLFLIWLGAFKFGALDWSPLGLLLVALALLPFYMAVSGSCFIFSWFKIHSLSTSERAMHGEPYPENLPPPPAASANPSS